ncbi:hypothetical protein CN221_33560 [Sinorhizobium meliloti]|uniref:hypothetical protein n=1 Tax=Sinorhizobium TaxID=28105 RepID=UPI000FE0F379|nr:MULTISPECIES: hypothetical protein [Sinorhizobium]MBO1959255.1 hypothetical protein [Sinorhizobium medicae]RVG84207.1 hypothetical protein CN221_33560 [Sinorhizobium meliloti]RVH54603.1 hypothetical protein CN209_35350 [Sinorhizobium meliloti]WQO44531.1 hypothetical protein U8C42_15085 [Sinorhizobium medicae]WQO64662.1 hypothetical protein U8C40_16220 [Sinorhizobium medicae]
MNAGPSPDQIHLDKIRARHGEASRDWTVGVRARGQRQLFARLLSGASLSAVVTVTEECGWQDEEFLMHAHADIEFLLRIYSRLVDRLAEKTRALHEDPPDKNYAAECAIKCGEPAFKKFLEECHGLERPLTDERAATKVRSVLGIGSRRQLNNDSAAAERWCGLRGHFDAWRRR